MPSISAFILSALFILAQCQKESLSVDITGSYGLYNQCPDGTYYSDVPGIRIHCEPYPWPASKHHLCWRNSWWKMQYRIDTQPIDISDPFDLLEANACKANCFCELSLDMSKFQCLDIGPPLRWNKSPPAYTKYRPTFQCDKLQLPDIFRLLPKDSVELMVSFSNVPSTSSQLKRGNQFFSTLSQTILQSAFPINGWILNVIDAGMQSRSFDTSEFFLFNLSFSNALHRLDIINQGAKSEKFTSSPLRFPDLDLILSNITASLEFIKLKGFDIAALPDVPPPCVNSLKSLWIQNAPNFDRLPSWISNSSQLIILVLDGVSEKFDWRSLKPMSNVQFFALTNTPMSTSPDELNFSSLFPQLESLDLSNMNLTVIRKNLLTDTTKLRFLDLSGNDLTNIPSFIGLGRLQWLGLAGISGSGEANDKPDCALVRTKRISLDQSVFIDLSNLITLEISGYEYVNLTKDAFIPLANLRVLGAACVGWNEIPATLINCCGINELRLQSNRLSGQDAIPQFLTEFASLSILDLRDNNISILPQALLSFPNPNDDLLDWIRRNIQGNPMNGSACEMKRFETAYKLEPVLYDGGNASITGLDQCEAKPKEKANLLYKVCKAAKAKNTIILKSKSGTFERTLFGVMVMGFSLTLRL